jgi:hypothetical protein
VSLCRVWWFGVILSVVVVVLNVVAPLARQLNNFGSRNYYSAV